MDTDNCYGYGKSSKMRTSKEIKVGCTTDTQAGLRLVNRRDRYSLPDIWSTDTAGKQYEDPFLRKQLRCFFAPNPPLKNCFKDKEPP